MVRQFKPEFIGNFLLALFNFIVRKLFYTATPDTNTMVVMLIGGQLKDRMTTFKIVPNDQPGLFKLRKYSINSRQTYFFAIL